MITMEGAVLQQHHSKHHHMAQWPVHRGSESRMIVAAMIILLCIVRDAKVKSSIICVADHLRLRISRSVEWSVHLDCHDWMAELVQSSDACLCSSTPKLVALIESCSVTFSQGFEVHDRTRIRRHRRAEQNADATVPPKPMLQPHHICYGALQ